MEVCEARALEDQSPYALLVLLLRRGWEWRRLEPNCPPYAITDPESSKIMCTGKRIEPIYLRSLLDAVELNRRFPAVLCIPHGKTTKIYRALWEGKPYAPKAKPPKAARMLVDGDRARPAAGAAAPAPGALDDISDSGGGSSSRSDGSESEGSAAPSVVSERPAGAEVVCLEECLARVLEEDGFADEPPVSPVPPEEPPVPPAPVPLVPPDLPPLPPPPAPPPPLGPGEAVGAALLAMCRDERPGRRSGRQAPWHQFAFNYKAAA